MEPDQPAQAPSADTHESKILSFTRKAVVDVAVLAAVGLLAFSILSDVWSSTYSIGAIEVPDSFSQDVEDRDGIATALRMEVGRLAKEAQTGVAVKPDVPGASEPDLTVAGTKIPLRYAAGLARRLLKLPYVSITGQLLPADAGPAAPVDPEDQTCRLEPGGGPEQSGKPMRLVLSRTDAATGPFFDCTGPFPAILHRGAWAILKLVDSVAAATLLSKNAAFDSPDQARALIMLRQALADAEAQEPPVWLQRYVPIWPDRVPRAHLGLGSTLLSMHNEPSALDEFKAADTEAVARSGFRRGSFRAADGESIIALNDSRRSHDRPGRDSLAGARAAACRSLSLAPDFDSATYHLAQGEDFRSRAIFRAHALHTCSASRASDRACAVYGDLLREHPDFVVAYQERGIMLLQRLSQLLETGQDGCGPADAKELIGREAFLVDAIDASFDAATLLNPTGEALSWLQWGIMEDLVQHPQTGPLSLAPADRERRLNLAIYRYGRSLRLDRSNYYTWQSLASSLSEKAELVPETEPGGRQSLTAEARTALCEALALARAGHERGRVEASFASLKLPPPPCTAKTPSEFPADLPAVEVVEYPRRPMPECPRDGLPSVSPTADLCGRSDRPLFAE